MMKICESISKALPLIYNQCINTGSFRLKANVVQMLFPNYRKIFERLVYDEIFGLLLKISFLKNDLVFGFQETHVPTNFCL